MTISYSNLLRLFISSWVVFLLCISHAYAEPLSIKIDAPTSVAGDSFYGIFLDGEIDKDAPRRLTEILRKIPTNGAINIYLNSSGGNLFAGMELGRIFRKLGASTSISKMGSDKNNSSRNGVCYSACSLAYLGGLYRYANTEAIYGVHRISSSMGPTNQDLDVGQIVSAAVSTYLIEMGIDARLFKLIANTSASDIYSFIE